jgi:hypothetical protein
MGVVTCPISYRELRIGGIGTEPLITAVGPRSLEPDGNAANLEG